MSTITKEWLQQKIADMEAARDETPFGLDEDDSNTLAAMRLALASLEAEPVCYLTWHQGFRAPDDCEEYVVEAKSGDKSCDGSPAFPVYAAPPAPVVPEEATPENIAILASTFAPRGVTYQWDRDECNAAADSWNTCRDAMLQGADIELQRKAAIHDALCEKYSVESLADFVDWQRNHITELESAPPAPVGPNETAVMPDYPGYVMTQRECFQAGAKRAVPDGWVVVPVEPTSEMQSAAAGAIRFNTTPINKLWTGNAVYKAMIAAAPQQEVK